MKRYFHTTVRPGSTAFHCDSAWNYLNLPDGSFIVCMFDSHHAPDPDWTELPHLLDNAPLPAALVAALGQLVTAPANCTTFQLVKLLAAHNPRFHP